MRDAYLRLVTIVDGELENESLLIDVIVHRFYCT